MVRRIHHPGKKQHRKERLHEINVFRDVERKGLLTRSPQSMLGISDNQLGNMFRSAWTLLDLHEASDAVKAFSLLCHIHPYVPDFWYGLGKSQRENEELQEAVNSFCMAETIDPSRFEFYEDAIECCLEMGKKKEALKILKRLSSRRRLVDGFEKRVVEFHRLQERIAQAESTSH
jgi:tetratricopeptide (TPR) repeat protein